MLSKPVTEGDTSVIERFGAVIKGEDLDLTNMDWEGYKKYWEDEYKKEHKDES